MRGSAYLRLEEVHFLEDELLHIIDRNRNILFRVDKFLRVRTCKLVLR